MLPSVQQAHGTRKRVARTLGVMGESVLPSPLQWGHKTASVSPGGLIASVAQATNTALANYVALMDDREPCCSADGYFRVSIEIPLSRPLADQLMNGSTGYRAHYAASVTSGESFNRALVQAIAPLVIEAAWLYERFFPKEFCARSLLGRFSKLWYPKELTDPSAQALGALKPTIRYPRWVRYWHALPAPHKGLLAPVSEGASVLLNGTFVCDDGSDFEQKPDRSQELYERGWT